MGRLPFPADAELTGPDRVVLDVLRKEYESHQYEPSQALLDEADESDGSVTKQTEFVSPSPEGELHLPTRVLGLCFYTHIENVD